MKPFRIERRSDKWREERKDKRSDAMTPAKLRISIESALKFANGDFDFFGSVNNA